MRSLIAALGLLLLAACSPALAEPGPVCDARWTEGASGRTVPVRIRLPEGAGKAPVILFSHGLGGSVDSGRLWVESWAAAGFAVVNVQHPGSDETQIGGGRLMRALNLGELGARVGDVRFVLDELARRRSEGACDLRRLDLTRVGMAGHSYGANTTQALAGQRLAGAPDWTLSDPRIKAAVAFSPMPAFRGSDQAAFGEVRMPFLSITGDDDVVMFLPEVTPTDRERPFRAMPAGQKYLLVAAGANHMTFNGQPELRIRGASPGAHVEALVIAATTDFWRSTLLGDMAARRRLDGGRLELGAGDRFEAR